ncbi:Pro-kumamolisin, activation domain-containing protein [Bisporella sp. PMI_857]|nr:Pro-kumamolisin, activation domain-containing protein [Bisporella sp. PMI_857]
MVFALIPFQSGVRAAEEAIQAISDSSSERYGMRLSTEQVNQLFAPSRDQIQETARWLTASSIPRSKLRISSDGSHIFFNISVEKAEQLISASYFEFQNGDSVQMASETLYLPSELSRHVDVVLPGVELELPPSVTKATPFDTKRLLMPMRHGKPVTESTDLNLDAFFSRYQPELVGHRPQLMQINRGYLQTDIHIWPFNLESNLDHKYGMALSYPLLVTNIQVGDKFLGSNLNTMLAAFKKYYCKTGLDPNFDPIYPNNEYPGGYNSSDCGVHDPALVISISYVWNEASFSKRYVRHQCLEYLKLGLRGVSVIVELAL